MPSFEEVDVKLLQDKESLNIISNLYEFENVLKSVVDKNETSFLTRYLIELGQSYSNFYNENKIICEDNKKLQDARVYLSVAVGTVLKTGAKLLGIEMPNKM